jgi:hypothetical protein
MPQQLFGLSAIEDKRWRPQLPHGVLHPGSIELPPPAELTIDFSEETREAAHRDTKAGEVRPDQGGRGEATEA